MLTKLRLATINQGPDYMLAARIGISPTLFSWYATGKRPIAPHHLIAICDTLNLQPEEVLGWEDESVIQPERRGYTDVGRGAGSGN